jgi:acetyl esterase/lipase
VSQALFFRELARRWPGIIYSRALRGPARPSWSFRYELFAATMRGMQFELGKRSYVEQRVAMDALARTYSPAVWNVDRSPTTLGGVPAEWFLPRFEAPVTLLYFHGGGYVVGSPTSHQDLIARIATASPAKVIAPDYRLAPENPFPAAIDDAVAIYRALDVPRDKLVVGGDSAGGGLALALLQRLGRDEMPAGAALICPWVDLTAAGGSLETNAPFDWGNEALGHTWIAAYLQGHDPKDPLASAVFGDLAGLPPLLIQVGQAELIYDQCVALAARARGCDVDARLAAYEDQIHDWHSFATYFPDCARPIDEIGSFIREVTRT